MFSIGGLLLLPVSPRTAWAWEREYIEMVKFNIWEAGDNYFVWLRCWKLRLLKGVWLISLYVLLKYPLKPRIFFPFQSQDLTIKNPELSRPEAQHGPWCCAWEIIALCILLKADIQEWWGNGPYRSPWMHFSKSSCITSPQRLSTSCGMKAKVLTMAYNSLLALSTPITFDHHSHSFPPCSPCFSYRAFCCP